MTNDLPAAKDSAITKSIFVIMPFSETPTRNRSDLDVFFDCHLKQFLERGHPSLTSRYVVSRSTDAFFIRENVILALHSADVVICDLSGICPNPNVMYELGIRVSLSNRPLILIRERHVDNRDLFDVSGFHHCLYDLSNIEALQTYLVTKLAEYETSADTFQSPVVRALQTEHSVSREFMRLKAIAIMGMMNALATDTLRHVGGYLTQFAGASHLVPSAYSDLPSYLVEHGATLDELDWNGFRFALLQCPPLADYMSTLPLREIVPVRLAYLVNTQVAGYFSEFLLTNRAWLRTSRRELQHFVLETRLLELVANHVYGYLLSNDSEMRTGMLKAAYELLAVSEFTRKHMSDVEDSATHLRPPSV